jgi:myosin heavy subunit
MGQNKQKPKDLFAELLADEVAAENQREGELVQKNLDDLNFDDDLEVDINKVLKSATNSGVSSMPPPPKGSKSLKSVKPVESVESVEVKEDSFENQFGVEASEIFPADSAVIRKNMDHTQKLPMADPFEISNDEPRAAKLLPKNVVDLQEHLRSSNYLEVAQNRVLELEKEVQKLRRDGEQLSAAGKHFKELTESLKMQVKQAESNYQNMQEISKEEKKILMQSLEAKEIKISALQERVQDVEQRQGSQYENVRIRERELENRLEIMKSENEALAKSKDEMILELKKQVQMVHSDLEKYRIQNQKMSSKMENKEELLRRTVKALRIALTMLEGSSSDEE